MFVIDENLSHRLAAKLENRFPGVISVSRALGTGATDIQVWEYAKANNLAILTRDGDFVDYWKRFGPPPKVIKLEIGNSRLDNIEALILSRHKEIMTFLGQKNEGILVLTG